MQNWDAPEPPPESRPEKIGVGPVEVLLPAAPACGLGDE